MKKQTWIILGIGVAVIAIVAVVANQQANAGAQQGASQYVSQTEDEAESTFSTWVTGFFAMGGPA